MIAHALSPAQVSAVEIIDETARSARVVVPDYQLSLAIGKEGQNARLAARMTGWRIDIRSDTARAGDAPAATPDGRRPGLRGGAAGRNGLVRRPGAADGVGRRAIRPCWRA